MCGINGVIRFNEDISKDELESMNKSIKHRGPDDNGIYIFNSKNLRFLSLKVPKIIPLDWGT